MTFNTRGDLVRAGIDFNFASPPATGVGMDMPVYKAPPLAFSWTGIYAGGHGGAGWAQMDWVFDSLSSSVSGPLPEGRHTARGALAGGQIGYNYQIGALVWGR